MLELQERTEGGNEETGLGEVGGDYCCGFSQIIPENADTLWGAAATWEFIKYPDK